MDVLSAAAVPNQLIDLLESRVPDDRTASAKPQAKESVGAQFESLFLSLLLKEMRQSLEPGSMFGEDKGDVLGGIFDTFLGEHLAKRGGLGIAELVNRQLMPPQNTNIPEEMS